MVDNGEPDDVREEDLRLYELAGTRVGAGVLAAGGGALVEGPQCPEPGSPEAAETVKIAFVTPDVVNLEVIGLGALVFDTPEPVLESYIDEINHHGGINGNCFELRYYEYGFTDPAGDFGRICGDLPQHEPLVMMGVAFAEPVFQCATLGARIPTIGLFSQWPATSFTLADELLWVDNGSIEFLLDNTVNAAVQAGTLTPADRVGLLFQQTDNAPAVRSAFDTASRRLGMDVAASAGVPPGFSETVVLVVEQQFREAGGEIFDPDAAAFERALAAMPDEVAVLLRQIRQHFLEVAAQFRNAGVTAVVASADWADVRNLMRAAELAGWFPTWVINDAHYVMLVLTDSPRDQGDNLLQVSSGRTVGDPLEGLDRGCLTVRNSAQDAEPFTHRHHTDAWSLLAGLCDYLDIVFAAITRVEGPLTRDSFLAALSGTNYELTHGSLIRFSDGDLFGADRFRVLSADSSCALNEWGCMRPVSEWFPLAGAAAGGGNLGGTADG